MSDKSSELITNLSRVVRKGSQLRRQQTVAGIKKRVRRKQYRAEQTEDEENLDTVTKSALHTFGRTMVIIRELLAALALYNDFYTDIQIVVFVSSLLQYRFFSFISTV